MADKETAEIQHAPTEGQGSRLAALRELAQKHLQEIGQQDEKERLEEQEVHAVLQEEAMRRSKTKTTTAEGHPAPSEDKGGKMRTAQDVLDRIRWDPGYNVEEFVVGYLDRFGGNKEIRAAEWLNEVTEEDWVPQHRIRYFKRVTGEGEEVVWHRYDRVDRIFGSTTKTSVERSGSVKAQLAAALSKARTLQKTTLRLASTMAAAQAKKLHGRAFYESLGSPKMILAPMVDRSEFAWRMLSRSYLPEESSKSLLAYSPMLHSRLFSEGVKFRDEHFQPKRSSLTSKEASDEPRWLDGNPEIDRPLFVQFCANKPEEFLEAAEFVAPYCDAVDLNLGCPQGIARSGQYGAFLQENWNAIHALISKLDKELSVPVTAKMRILETREKTLEYAKMILSAGASILTVHGRRREQKGHNTGLADWSILRYLRDNLPPETVLFANGNILNHGDIQSCLDATGFDGVMSAEANLADPTIFAGPPPDPEIREYWRGIDGKSGYRIDGVVRRYLDIIHRYVLEQDPPQRTPLYLPGDDTPEIQIPELEDAAGSGQQGKSRKRKRDRGLAASPNLRPMQGHLFGMLRAVVSKHTDIRDALAKCRPGEIAHFERVLLMLERAVQKALDEEAAKTASSTEPASEPAQSEDTLTSTEKTLAAYSRPWWVCQPFIRPSPEEALAKGSMQVSKKAAAKAESDKRLKVSAEPLHREERPEVVDKVSQTPTAAVVCG